MEKKLIIPVILSGGSGTRLWPLSRALKPKQLLPLVNATTMIQDTITRLNGIKNLSAPVIVCNEDHRFMIAEQMREIGIQPAAIILEPVGRNTAPAVAVSAEFVNGLDKDAVLLVLPADHVIQNTQAFHAAIATGYDAAQQNKLVTFGIVPTTPETGYGYIKAGKQTSVVNVHTVECFVEKPNKTTAEQYIAEGHYYWNSGMFMFKASRFINELAQHNKAMLEASQHALSKAKKDMDFIRLDKPSFEQCPSDSIDYAVMEKTKDAVIIPVDIGWNDIGSWPALCGVNSSDMQGNVVHGDVYTIDTHNSYIRSESRLVTVVGVNDHVIVETADAILVAHKDSAQNVKDIVDHLKKNHRSEATIHKKAYRPWGSYECIDVDERFQVKRITVNPDARLSLQLHHHRAEHWIVVKGTARVTCNDNVFLLAENESTFIPLGSKHRLENTGKIPLELIEVQTGSYLGEDDIVRFEDVYGREQSTK